MVILIVLIKNITIENDDVTVIVMVNMLFDLARSDLFGGRREHAYCRYTHHMCLYVLCCCLLCATSLLHARKISMPPHTEHTEKA